MTDTLTKRLKTGDKSAFVELVNEFQERIITTCYTFLGSEDDARDTAQEVFVEIFISVKRFREDADLSTWIYRIAVNKSLDLLRRKNRKKRFSLLQKSVKPDWNEHENIPGTGPSPSAILEARETRALVMHALKRIPVNQRIAWTLHKMDGLPHSEIALIMDTTVPAVESLIHRARNNLRAHLKKMM